MNKSISLVKDFMVTFKQPVLNSPTIPAMDRIKLRLSLILEELDELAEAAGAREEFAKMLTEKSFKIKSKSIEGVPNQPEPKSLVGCLDAFCDLQYVLDGAIQEFGMANEFLLGFQEVHDSNMSKVCHTEQEAFDTMDHHAAEHGACHVKESNGKFLVYRSSDNKVMKSKYYKPAQLDQFIEK